MFKTHPLYYCCSNSSFPHPLPGPEEGTVITHAIENTDPDELYVGPTYNTDSTEASDPDEFRTLPFPPHAGKSDPTHLTFTLEATDPDELHLTIVSTETATVNHSDFDEILFL